ncbi:hypothetical protein [Aliiglaciecola litoralis]
MKINLITLCLSKLSSIAKANALADIGHRVAQINGTRHPLETYTHRLNLN